MIILGSYVVTYFSTTVCLVKLSIPPIYHSVATNSEEHMVQVIGTKIGSHLGQIDLPQFHPAALTLSLDSQDIFIVSEGDSKSTVPMQIHSLTV